MIIFHISHIVNLVRSPPPLIEPIQYLLPSYHKLFTTIKSVPVARSLFPPPTQ